MLKSPGMTKAPPSLAEGFSPENVIRIYHGEPALLGRDVPANLLEEREFEAIACLADGLTQREVAEVLGKPGELVERSIQRDRNRLGILDSLQLAGYFPLDPDHGAVGDKKLADLEAVPHGLDILEAISVGKRNKQIAAAAGINRSHIRKRLSDMEGVWEDVEGGLMLARVAGAIRTRYVRAVEASPGIIQPKHIPLFTLPRLARMEPRIHREFPGTSAPDQTK